MNELERFYDFLDTSVLYEEHSFKELLNKNRLSSLRLVSALSTKSSDSCALTDISSPKFYCSNNECKSKQYYEPIEEVEHLINFYKETEETLRYRCRNCRASTKTFLLRIELKTLNKDSYPKDDTSISIQKIGEYPKFGKPIPNQALKLLGKERDLFFKGSTCENLGMGIAAFSYYRRVIDSKKDKLFDEIIKVLKLNSGNEVLVKELSEAKQEPQFTKALNKIKSILPESLKVKGHDPLKLMYKALSEGLHNKTDEECLRNAKAIKTIFFAFTERLDTILKEDKMVSEALKDLV